MGLHFATFAPSVRRYLDTALARSGPSGSFCVATVRWKRAPRGLQNDRLCRERTCRFGIGTVGCAGLHGNGADLPLIRVVGVEEWQEFWEQTG